MKIASGEKSRVGNRLLKTWVGLAFIGLLLSVYVSAQENPTGTLNGKVSSVSGGPISDAKVTITNRTTGQTSTVRTDATGGFSSSDLAVSDYSVTVDAKGFI